jgi:drug/metabolite transporter (DMT)-like permease
VTPFELLLVLASALLHAIWSAWIKGSDDPLAFNLLQEAVGMIGALLILPFFVLGEIPAAVWKLTAATGIAHGLYFYFMSRAYQEADLSLVYPIIRSTPAILPLIAVPLLGESVSPWGGLGIAILVFGIWLIHADRSPKLGTLRSRGMRFAYLTLAATVAYSLLDKQAMVHLSEAQWTGPLPRTIVFYFILSVANNVVFAPLALRRVSWATLREAGRRDGLRAAAAFAGSLASYSLILQAFQTAPASYVVAVRQMSVLFAVLFAVVWLRERPDRRRVIGAAATVAGVALISLMR